VNPSLGAPGAASMPRTAPRMNPEREAAVALNPQHGGSASPDIQ